MAGGVGQGILEGLGEGLGDIGDRLHEKKLRELKDRDKQADDLTEQIKSMADNIAKMGGQNAPEAAPLVQQLKTTIDQHNALFPAHETPALLQRLKTLTGHKPGAPKPDVRASLTPEASMAAAPVQQNSVLQEMNDLKATRVAQGDSPEEAGKFVMDYFSRKYAGPKETPDEWSALQGDAGKPYKIGDKVFQNQSNKAGQTRQVELQGMPATALTDETKPKKPLTRNINSVTGGLDSIEDPNTGAFYTASSIPTAPPEIQQVWNDITGQVSVEQARKKAIEDERAKAAEERQTKQLQAAVDRQETGFKNLLDSKDYESAKKVVMTSDSDYQDALDRMSTMDKNQVDAKKGDQQAMLSLVANHIGMTLGAQKGARITRAAFDEAVSSAPWLDKVAAKWSSDGYLSGVTLAPEQMEQMVRLAREKVDVLKEHKRRVEDEYHDALNPRPPAGGPKSGKSDPQDEEILRLLKGK